MKSQANHRSSIVFLITILLLALIAATTAQAKKIIIIKDSSGGVVTFNPEVKRMIIHHPNYNGRHKRVVIEKIESLAALYAQEKSLDGMGFAQTDLSGLHKFYQPICSSLTFNINLNATAPISTLSGHMEKIAGHILNSTTIKDKSTATKSYRIDSFILNGKMVTIELVANSDGVLQQFKILSANGETPLDLFITLDKRGEIIVKDRNNKTILVLDGNKLDLQNGGELSLHYSQDGDQQFEHMLYQLKPDPADTAKWKITKTPPDPSLPDLSADKNADVSLALDAIKLPFTFIAALGDATFGSFFWNVAFTKEGREKKVAEKIVEKASENRTVSDNLSLKEIKALAKEVAQMHTPGLMPFTNKETVGREARKLFLVKTLAKMLADIKIPKSEIPNMVEQVTADYMLCLKDANGEDQMESCDAKFSVSATYRVGEKVLLYTFRDKLGAMLSSAEFARIETTARDQYRRCAQKRYFPLIKQARKKIQHEQSKDEQQRAESNLQSRVTNVIKGCVMAAMTNAAQHTIESSAADTFALQYATDLDGKVDPNPSTEIKQAAKQSATQVVNHFNQCLQSKNIVLNDGKSANFAQLKLAGTDGYASIVTLCANNTKDLGAKLILGRQLMTNPDIAKTFNTSNQKGILAVTEMKRMVEQQALAPCRKIQEEDSYDPKNCIGVVMAKTVEASALHAIRAKLAEQLPTDHAQFNSIYTNTEKVIKECMRPIHQKLLNSSKNQPSVMPQQRVVDCIKQGSLMMIKQVTPHVVKRMIDQEGLNESGEISLSPDQLNKLTQINLGCFKQQTTDIASVETFAPSMEKATPICKELVTRAAIPMLTPQILEASTKEYITDDAVRSEFIQQRQNSMKELLTNLPADQPSMGQIANFELESRIAGVDLVLQQNLEEAFPTGKGTTNGALQARLRHELLTTPFKERLAKVVQNKDKSQKRVQMKELLNEFSINGAKAMSQELIAQKLAGKLRNPQATKALIEKLTSEFSQCLDQGESGFKEKLKKCTEQSTHRAVDLALAAKLEEIFPMEEDLNKEDQDKIIQLRQTLHGTLITDSLKLKLTTALNAPTKQQQRTQMAHQMSQFAITSAKTIAPKLLAHQLSGVVKDPQQSRETQRVLIDEYNQCLDNPPLEISSRGKPDIETLINWCSNDLKFRSSQNIMLKKTRESLTRFRRITIDPWKHPLRYIKEGALNAFKPDDVVMDKIEKQGERGLTNCSKSVSKFLPSDGYNKPLQQCRLDAIIGLFSPIVEAHIAQNDLILSNIKIRRVREKTKLCLNGIKWRLKNGATSAGKPVVTNEKWMVEEIKYCGKQVEDAFYSLPH